MQLKKNQGKLYQALAQLGQQRAPLDEVEVKEKKRGVLTTWHVQQFPVGELPTALAQKWPSLQRLLVIDKTVVDKLASAISSTSLYVSDITNLTAKDFAQGIGGHWGIENRSHWVGDVILEKDDNGIVHTTGAVNMALFNTIALNFLRHTIDDSIKDAQIIFGQNVKELFPTIRT